MIYHEIDQNSEEWNLLRLGKFTASTFSSVFMGKDTKGYKDAIIKVAYERVTGECEEMFSNKWMQRGNEKEQFAHENYELITFRTLEKVGFFEYSEFIGASPDRKILGINAGCEFKCPSFQVYNEFLETGKLPKIYYWQIHGQLLCTGWDFIDYMPFSSIKLKSKILTIEKDLSIQNELLDKLNEAIEDVKRLENIIRNDI